MKRIIPALFLLACTHLWSQTEVDGLKQWGFTFPEEMIQAGTLRVISKQGSLDLSKTGRPVLLYFWSSSIPSSLEDLPILQELEKELQDDDLLIAPVNLNDDYPIIAGIYEQYNLELPVFCFPETADLAPYILNMVPCAYLLYGDGRVAASIQGNAPWLNPDIICSLRKIPGSSKP